MVKVNLNPAHTGAGTPAWVQEWLLTPDARRIRFLWTPGFLELAFAEPETRTRGADRSGDGVAVLADIFMMDEETFSIEGQLLEAPQNKVTLQLRLIAPPKRDGTPGILLKWGKEERRATFRNGVARIENLPPLHPKPKPLNEPPPEFSVTLVFDNA